MALVSVVLLLIPVVDMKGMVPEEGMVPLTVLLTVAPLVLAMVLLLVPDMVLLLALDMVLLLAQATVLLPGTTVLLPDMATDTTRATERLQLLQHPLHLHLLLEVILPPPTMVVTLLLQQQQLLPPLLPVMVPRALQDPTVLSIPTNDELRRGKKVALRSQSQTVSRLVKWCRYGSLRQFTAAYGSLLVSIRRKESQ